MRAISDTRSCWSPSNKKLVIAGLDPAIHHSLKNYFFWMDARIKSGHDEKLL